MLSSGYNPNDIDAMEGLGGDEMMILVRGSSDFEVGDENGRGRALLKLPDFDFYNDFEDDYDDEDLA